MKKNYQHITGFLVKRCPKSGRIVGLKSNLITRILFPIIGIVAIIWFLVRVIPKPSRLAYPCQQVAAGIGGSFLLYLFGAISSIALYDQIRTRLSKRLALTYLVSLVFIVSVGYGLGQIAKPDFVPNVTPPEGRNNPMGVARGIYPGRVAWTQDFDATSWDEKTGNWFDDQATNQEEVTKMMSVTLQKLTGVKTDKEAWEKLFIYNNQQNGRGNKGYTKGEKIVIKINMNAIHKAKDQWKNQGYPSPHMLNALIRQLIDVVGVRGEDIVITDPSRFIGPELYNRIRDNKSPEYSNVIFEENKGRDLPKYRTAKPDPKAEVWFTMPDGSRYKMNFPTSYSEATYMINYAIVRPHRVFAITCVAKNHFGAVYNLDSLNFRPQPLHAFAQWDYPTPNKLKEDHSAPVLMGHKITFNKSFLYMADGLYTSLNQTWPLKRWSTFNEDWFSSLLMSQDPVALESVVYDFICSEPNLISKNPSFNGQQDNQFQECALANDPPSGTKYDPENTGRHLQSLGVHEHWNNASDRQYSRNLGKKTGIELVSTILKK
jgi:hypothetical protein